MKKKSLFLGLAILVSFQTHPAAGDLFEISVSTDKPTYLLGEPVGISITAFNPNDYEIQLEHWAGYNIDDVAWLPVHSMQVVPPISLPPLDSYTWDYTHFHGLPFPPEMYPLLEVGVHSVVGAATIDATNPRIQIQSEPFQFSVVPEPATLVLLGTAGIWIFTHKKRHFIGGRRGK